ncbi:uncharacterized protein EI90DRAFT_3072300 [Cantharellus anzutake]|uniref:uncharacterized protein n=1 Tax=Cantharellus anzutake TaxID=1750568 RepID=UPI0019050E75|nr:uncharacterized protein EI90DRAFT_3072300 [Cantharellus anzutake]KAF8325631.1 hypothetical protein EI90DRAFT_3072300 [Cantharellus anzutake]
MIVISRWIGGPMHLRSFPWCRRKRMVAVGWVYEDDEDFVLTRQWGYQGAFVLCQDLFVRVTRNVDPTMPDLNEPSSWGTRTEPDGIPVVALG